MDRRDFIAGTAALLVSPRRSWAQGPPRRVGYLDTAPLYLPNYKVWQDSMRNHGWIEGKNLIVDYRSAEGHAERVVPLANELVALKPDVLVGPSSQEALALKSATASIPIVFFAVTDPVRLGLVQSLSHPGGNITGLAAIVPGNILSKGIQILREMVPAASKIAVLVNPSYADHRFIVAEELPEPARKLGVTFPVLEATTVEELDIAFACTPVSAYVCRPVRRVRRSHHQASNDVSKLMHRSKAKPYSITSSARTSNEGGTERPSALAVFMLMTSSNFVGGSTG